MNLPMRHDRFSTNSGHLPILRILRRRIQPMVIPRLRLPRRIRHRHRRQPITLRPATWTRLRPLLIGATQSVWISVKPPRPLANSMESRNMSQTTESSIWKISSIREWNSGWRLEWDVLIMGRTETIRSIHIVDVPIPNRDNLGALRQSSANDPESDQKPTGF